MNQCMTRFSDAFHACVHVACICMYSCILCRCDVNHALYVCVCACIHVCLFMSVYVCLCVCMYEWMHAWMHILQVPNHARLCVCVCVTIHTVHVQDQNSGLQLAVSCVQYAFRAHLPHPYAFMCVCIRMYAHVHTLQARHRASGVQLASLHSQIALRALHVHQAPSPRPQLQAPQPAWSVPTALIQTRTSAIVNAKCARLVKYPENQLTLRWVAYACLVSTKVERGGEVCRSCMFIWRLYAHIHVWFICIHTHVHLICMEYLTSIEQHYMHVMMWAYTHVQSSASDIFGKYQAALHIHLWHVCMSFCRYQRVLHVLTAPRICRHTHVWLICMKYFAGIRQYYMCGLRPGQIFHVYRHVSMHWLWPGRIRRQDWSKCVSLLWAG
jgi:hypothetical protein